MKAWLTQRSFAAKTVGLVFIFLLAKLTSIAQNAEVYHIHYKIDEETSATVIHQIKQDSIGFVWLATDRGIVRFDGERFIQYDLSDLAPSNEFFGISVAPDGKLWFFSAERALIYWDYKAQKFELSNFSTKVKPKRDVINSLVWKKDTLYVDFSTRYISKIWSDQNGSIYSKDLNTSLNYHQLILGENDFTTLEQKRLIEKNLFQYVVNDKVIFEQKIEGLVPFGFMTSVMSKNCSYLFTNEHLTKINKKGRVDFSYYYEGQQTPNGLTIQNSKNIWVSFYGQGITLFRLGENVTTTNYLKGITVTSSCIANDKHGIWCSTLDDGFYFIPDTSSYILSDKQTFKYIFKVGQYIVGIPKVGSALIYNSTNCEVILSNIRIQNPTDEFSIADTFFISSSGMLSKFYIENTELKVKQINLQTIKINKVSKVISSPNSLLLERRAFQNDSIILQSPIKTYSIPQKRLPDSFKSAEMNSHGDIFFTSHKNYQGLISSKSNDVQIFSTSLPIGQIDFIRRIHFLNDTIIEIVAQSGIFKFNINDSLNLDTIFHSKNLKINTLNRIRERDFISTESGVFKVLGSNTSEKITQSLFERNDNWVFDCLESNGFLYLATKNGIFKINELLFTKIEAAPPTITSVYLNGKPIIKDSITIDFHQKTIRFEWSAFRFHTKVKSASRWRINDKDEWQITNKPELDLSGLSPGKYLFEVQCSGSNEIWSKSAYYHFTILPPWYQTTWFIGLNAVLFSGLLYLLFLLRFNNLKEKLDLREAALAAQNQALGAQLNPHFIFNSMNTVSSFIAQEDDTKALRYISKLSVMLRRIFANAQKSTITLDEELLSVKQYIEIEQLRFGKKLRFHFKNTSKLSLDKVHVPSMLIQPFIENAIKHAVLKTENGGNIWLNIIDDKNCLKVVIEDDGPGFSEEILTKRKDAGESSISAIQKRLSIIKSLGEESAKLTIEKGQIGAKITLSFSVNTSS